MEESVPHITREQAPQGARARLQGQWTAARLAEPAAWEGIQGELQALAQPALAGCEWDLHTVQGLDHTGAQLLWNAWGRQWPQNLNLLPGQRAMLAGTRRSQHRLAQAIH